ncbi:hypothetical protein IP69_15955 [Bosea sp. AAP35]|uniref:type II toxin-antitoxin system VapC family toxin n=1 Tax=Bosea sp. AAP35 TaxID=1523417 RepID=UPI0006B8BDE2|nr:type II toxin-antitoxin system VapC family toxin [Bosea sp. AAP35]KPF65968.1 hypothetical protein IP69_15955 [Bosea sp. AAP35]
MIALDTNIVVRLITEDDPRQVARARALILARGGLVQTTVVMETEWVLRSVYGFSRAQIVAAFSLLGATDQLSVEAPERFAMSLEAYRGGMDFADAVHLAACDDVAGFGTFDAALVAGAARAFPMTNVIIP